MKKMNKLSNVISAMLLTAAVAIPVLAPSQASAADRETAVQTQSLAARRSSETAELRSLTNRRSSKAVQLGSLTDRRSSKAAESRSLTERR